MGCRYPLSGEGLVVPAIEEESDMGKFLEFGDPQWRKPGAANDFAQGVIYLGWRKSYR